jgi:hypothetical protein
VNTITQEQLVETQNIVAGAIAVILVVVLGAWGFRQFRRVVSGEPVEELPFEPTSIYGS